MGLWGLEWSRQPGSQQYVVYVVYVVVVVVVVVIVIVITQ